MLYRNCSKNAVSWMAYTNIKMSRAYEDLKNGPASTELE